MSFLSPLFLFGALAAGIPIVLHLLKREPDARVKFSAVKLLRHAPIERAHKRHLRELLLLALRVAGLLLLALAFARPFFSSNVAANASDITIVLLDTSASMSAPGQFDRARQLAVQAINRAAGHLVSVMTFADVPTIASRPSADRALALAAVNAAHAGAGATSYRSALTAAGDLMEHRSGTIIVVTDLQATGWSVGDRAAIPESARIEVADVGAPPANLAVTSARVSTDRVVATISNTSQEARDAAVTLDAGRDENPAHRSRIAETRVPVGANRTADVTFPVPSGRWAAVAVVDSSGAAADNARYVVLDGASQPTVLVITATGALGREAFYVEQALLASRGETRPYRVEGVAGRELQEWNQSRMDGHAAIVLLSTRGLEHHARTLLAEYARQGGGVLVAAAEDVDGAVLAEALGGAKVALLPPGSTPARPVSSAARALVPSDVRHPVLQVFSGRSSLGLVRFRKWTTVRPDGCQTLARLTSGEPALADCELGQGRALILASDLDNRWNDFPLHATFVPFIHEAVRYLSGAGRASDYVVGHAPAGVPSEPGVALSPAPNGAGRLVAVNVNPAEADAARLTSEEFLAAVIKVKDVPTGRQHIQHREDEERQHVWQFVLALMLAMLCVESLVATRTA